MRCESAAMAKGTGTCPPNLKPREGSNLRAIYDRLRDNRARVVTLEKFRHHRFAIESLKDFYGLDIRSVKRKGYRGAPAQYMLVGEWFGKTYVDYVAERISAGE